MSEEEKEGLKPAEEAQKEASEPAADEVELLEAKVAEGRFSFGDTLRLKRLKKIKACEEAKENLKQTGVSDAAKLYAYIAALEKRLEALEEEVEFLRCRAA